MKCTDCKKNDGHYEGAFPVCQNPTPDGGACLNPNYWGYSFVTVRVEPIARPGGNEYVVRATHKDYPGVVGVAPCPAPDCDDSEAERLALENLIARLATDALVGATKPIAKTMESREIMQRDLGKAPRPRPTLADRLRDHRKANEKIMEAALSEGSDYFIANGHKICVGDTVLHTHAGRTARTAVVIGIRAAYNCALINYVDDGSSYAQPFEELFKCADMNVLACSLRTGDRIVWEGADRAFWQVRAVLPGPIYQFMNLQMDWDPDAVVAALRGELNAPGAQHPRIVRRELLPS